MEYDYNWQLLVLNLWIPHTAEGSFQVPYDLYYSSKLNSILTVKLEVGDGDQGVAKT